MEVANTRKRCGHSPREFRESPVAKHGETSCRRVDADGSIRQQSWLRDTGEPCKSFEYHGWNIERRFGYSSTGTSTSTCGVACSYPAANDTFWRRQGWQRSELSANFCFFIAALQYEHEAQDRTEVAVSEAIAQTQAGHASRVFQDEASC